MIVDGVILIHKDCIVTYHSMYREARKEWSIVPYQEAIKLHGLHQRRSSLSQACGHLWIAETTSRFENLGNFQELLMRQGFDIVKTQFKGNFTFFSAIKSDRVIN